MFGRPSPRSSSVVAAGPWLLALALVTAARSHAQAPTTTFPLGQWTLNPGAERSQLLATGELLGPGRFRVALQTHGLSAPADGSVALVQQLREHVLAAVGLTRRLQLAVQVPALMLQRPAPTQAVGLARPWAFGRIGLLSPDLDDALWLALDLGLGIPGFGQSELTVDPPGPVGSLKLSAGFPSSRGVVGVEAELRMSSARLDVRGGVALVSQGIHLKGEFVVRGDVSVSNPHGFVEALAGIRYVLRPVELSLIAGPGYGLASQGLDVRVIAGLGFVSPRDDDDAQHGEQVDCTEGTDYRLEACPKLDFDGDGLLNGVDRCPRDFGPKDNQGCPWPDTDSDGVLDHLDNCPTVPGPPENYGCPPGKRQLVVIRKERLEILEKVYFEFNKATIKPESFELLDQVAAIIESHPELHRVRVEGHTDKVGSAAYNRRLSLERARSVEAYLTEKGGVAAARLSAAGFGFDRPVATDDTEEGRAQNRRVEFMILGDDEPATDGADEEPAPEAQ